MKMIRPKGYEHLDSLEYGEGARAMIGDLELLARRDGCVAAGWVLAERDALYEAMERQADVVARLKETLLARREAALARQERLEAVQRSRLEALLVVQQENEIPPIVAEVGRQAREAAAELKEARINAEAVRSLLTIVEGLWER